MDTFANNLTYYFYSGALGAANRLCQPHIHVNFSLYHLIVKIIFSFCFYCCFHKYRRQRECYYGDVFIASNKQVDTHIQKLYQGAKSSVCYFIFIFSIVLMKMSCWKGVLIYY